MFRYKPDKARFDVRISTIDGTHRKITEKFKKEQKSLPSKNTKLGKLTRQFNKLDNKDKEKYTIEDVKRKSQLKEEITLIKYDINEIEEHFNELEYLFDTHEILTDYYENEPKITYGPMCDDIKTNDDINTNLSTLDKFNKMRKSKIKKMPKKRIKNNNKSNTSNIISMLKSSNEKNNNKGKNSKNSKTTIKSSSNLNTCANISNTRNNDPEKKTKVTRKQKAALLDDFLILINSDYVSSKKHCYNPSIKCPNCGHNRIIIHSEGICVCRHCAVAESIIVDSDRPNYKDNMPEKSGYPYKRINVLCGKVSHFVHLSPVQMKMFVISVNLLLLIKGLMSF